MRRAALLAAWMLAAGCGGKVAVDAPSVSTTGGPGGAGAAGGAGGAPLVCVPGATLACPYAGPPGTEGVGICKAAVQTCNGDGSGFGPCAGEVLPAAEDCATTTIDESCDGVPTCGGAIELAWNADGVNILDLALDGEGNVLLLAGISGVVDLGGGPIGTSGDGHIVVMKRDPNAGYLWARIVDTKGGFLPGSIAVDHQGNALVAASFFGSVDFGNGPVMSGPGGAVVVAKIDPGGAPVWTRAFLSSTQPSAYGVATDASDHVIVTGAFGGLLDVDGTPLQSTGGRDVYVIKLDADSSVTWSRNWSDVDIEDASGVAADAAGSIFVVGSSGGNELTLRKLDAAGNPVWGLSAPMAIGSEVAVTGAGEVALGGHYFGPVDFGAGPTSDIVAARFSSGGELVSQTVASAPGFYGRHLAAGGAGEIAVLGVGQQPIDLGSGLQGSMFGPNAALAKIDKNGNIAWSHVWSGADNIDPAAVAVTPEGKVWIGGWMAGTVDFGAGPVTQNGAFLVRFAP